MQPSSSTFAPRCADCVLKEARRRPTLSDTLCAFDPSSRVGRISPRWDILRSPCVCRFISLDGVYSGRWMKVWRLPSGRWFSIHHDAACTKGNICACYTDIKQRPVFAHPKSKSWPWVQWIGGAVTACVLMTVSLGVVLVMHLLSCIMVGVVECITAKKMEYPCT